MAIAISILALILGFMAASPTIKKWIDLLSMPARASDRHEWLLLLHSGQMKLQETASGQPETINTTAALWWEYRRLCKYSIEPDGDILQKTIERFAKERRRYVKTAELEPLDPVDITETGTSPHAPPGVFDFDLARRFGTEYTSTGDNELPPQPRDSRGTEVREIRARTEEEIEKTRKKLQRWLKSKNSEVEAVAGITDSEENQFRWPID